MSSGTSCDGPKTCSTSSSDRLVFRRFLRFHSLILSQGIATLLGSQRYENDWGTLFAALTIAMVPVIVVYLVFYRQVQAGLTGATLK